MTRSEVEILFDKAIAEKLKDKPEVAKLVLRHERKGVCIDQLTHQIRLLELQSRFARLDRITPVIESLAMLFANRALTQKQEQIMSEAEKSRRVKEADTIKEAEGLMKELTEEATTTATTHFMKGKPV